MSYKHPSNLCDDDPKKRQSQHPRQRISCTECRKRKTKCDRIKPCLACCTRRAPRECQFLANEVNHTLIQRSYELRELRIENSRLRERLHGDRSFGEDERSDASLDPRFGERPITSLSRGQVASRTQRRSSEWSDMTYFGSPGLATVVMDFAAVNLPPTFVQSHVGLITCGVDVHTQNIPSPYPFATLFKAASDEFISQLLSILPLQGMLMNYLSAFEKRIHMCSFPDLPFKITKAEVERFLSDVERNSIVCPDMLAFLFAAIALGVQPSRWEQSGGGCRAEVVDEESQRSNVYIAAAIQAVRLRSFMHKPSLLRIQTLIIIDTCLRNSGRFMDAWTLFGTTIRLAQAIGLHRNPKYLTPAPPTQEECLARQTLWWWILHMDERYALTLGRPLGISGIGDCPAPFGLTIDPHSLRLCEFTARLTVLARQIMANARLTNAKIDEITDYLRALLVTIPKTVGFDESWVEGEIESSGWPMGAMAAVCYLKTHTYLILLNCKRSNKPNGTFHLPNVKGRTSSASLRGRSLVLASSKDVLNTFLFIYARAPSVIVPWAVEQQAFNCCMILILDALETGNTIGIGKVLQAYEVFRVLGDNNVCQIARLAVVKIGLGLRELGWTV